MRRELHGKGGERRECSGGKEEKEWSKSREKSMERGERRGKGESGGEEGRRKCTEEKEKEGKREAGEGVDRGQRGARGRLWTTGNGGEERGEGVVVAGLRS